MKHATMTAIALAISLCGCVTGHPATPIAATGPDLLVGCYAQSADGGPSLSVTRKDGRYFLAALPDDGAGRSPLELFQKPLPGPGRELPATVEAILGTELGMPAVLKFAPGAVVEGQPMESEYYFFAAQVGGTLFRRDCPAPTA